MWKLYKNFHISTFKKEKFPRKLYSEIRYLLKVGDINSHYPYSLSKIECHLFCCHRQAHTVAFWTFTLHKISGFVRMILKANFKQLYRPKVSIFLFENSKILFSFSFYFLQELSNPVLFSHC